MNIFLQVFFKKRIQNFEKPEEIPMSTRNIWKSEIHLATHVTFDTTATLEYVDKNWPLPCIKELIQDGYNDEHLIHFSIQISAV